ncbi:DUF4252 domain-containing protein [Chitinophaga sp. Cy-1792]|uniref:DUF4252 domain-containing protein n=1 Tax=Chitinophaga sp. Cy-1792 TaxID=2608339 RepID=UPI0014211D10|nr:DUF4252 domain-containing protein [Chitinophaga sp. Cy-1792]NIG56127.1 DUF4252 domain-containing protein [Chitinophaga sp. Cy-1792]
MKSLLFGCAMMLMATAAAAQDKSIREFTDNFKGKADVTNVNISSLGLRFAGLITKMAEKNDPDVQTFRKLLKHISHLTVYAFENMDSASVSANDVARLKRSLESRENFEMLMEVREKSSQIYVLNKGKDDELGKLVMLVQDEKDLAVISLKTSLKMDDVNDLVKHFASKDSKVVTIR